MTGSSSPAPVRVRTAGAQDATDLAELAAVTFPLACPPGSTAADQRAFLAEHLSAERFLAYVADAERLVLVAEDLSGTLLGYTMLVGTEPTDPDVRDALSLFPAIELSKCYVHPEHHGSGVSSVLMAARRAVKRQLAGCRAMRTLIGVTSISPAPLSMNFLRSTVPPGKKRSSHTKSCSSTCMTIFRPR